MKPIPAEIKILYENEMIFLIPTSIKQPTNPL
jgi:hypothetical protein